MVDAKRRHSQSNFFQQIFLLVKDLIRYQICSLMSCTNNSCNAPAGSV